MTHDVAAWRQLLAFAAALVGALTAGSVHAATAAPPVATRSQAAQGGAALDREDVDAWLDGLLPYALARGSIAGAQVVVVKDGRILTQRGFGHADLAANKKVDGSTMFRAGSVSKLFTWTAVMQLVEQGRIDLDVDVNRYLDFTIPAYDGKPIAMRQIMTHTAGFDEVVKGGFSFGGSVRPLGDVVKSLLPARVRAPGVLPAYSNYATALAGYIVERVSGIPFNRYIEQKIFQPLGMTHSTFDQPLPAALDAFMAKGYPSASVAAKPFEMISVPPAGSLSMSGTDAARFMIAQLDRGAGLMKPETAEQMQRPGSGAIPGLNRMALGFYEQRLDKVAAIAHGGDLYFFHGYMWLFPERGVGLYLAMNSAGKERVTGVLREALFEQFADRYLGARDGRPLTELPTALEHAKLLAGSYGHSRGPFTSFLAIGTFLNQYTIGLDESGRPLVPEFFGGPPRQWIEVAPFQWQDPESHARLGAVVEDGRVVRWSVNEFSPFMTFERLPWHRDASWLMPAFMAGLTVVAITALSWPIAAIVRRRHGVAFALQGTRRKAYRLLRGLAWLALAVLGGWALLLSLMEFSAFDLDPLIWLLQIAGAVGLFGLPAVAMWSLLLTWREDRRGLPLARGALVVAAAAALLWVAIAFHLVGFGTRY